MRRKLSAAARASAIAGARYRLLSAAATMNAAALDVDDFELALDNARAAAALLERLIESDSVLGPERLDGVTP